LGYGTFTEDVELNADKGKGIDGMQTSAFAAQLPIFNFVTLGRPFSISQYHSISMLNLAI